MFYNGVILKEKPFQPGDLFFAIIPGIFYAVKVIQNKGKQLDDQSAKNIKESPQKPVMTKTNVYVAIVLILAVIVIWTVRIVTL